jgi:hypothetical protein
MMDIEEARTEVYRLLDADVAELTDGGSLAVFPPSEASGWDLPPRDRAALQTLGLPPQREDGLYSLYGDYEVAPRTDRVPDGEPYYVVGRFGVTTIAASAGTGSVLAIPKYSAEEIHPQLRATHGPLIRVQHVNSSLTALVELSWRYYRLVPIIAGQLNRAGDEELAAAKAATSAEERAKLPDFYAPVRSLLREIADRFAAADPAIEAGPDAFWDETITEE